MELRIEPGSSTRIVNFLKTTLTVFFFFLNCPRTYFIDQAGLELIEIRLYLPP